jgi:glycosyltransferase involved in cell wall biosynthesis
MTKFHLFVHHTSNTIANSGVQRVVRLLFWQLHKRSLISSLIAYDEGFLRHPNHSELETFFAPFPNSTRDSLIQAYLSGPDVPFDSSGLNPDDTILIPEVPALISPLCSNDILTLIKQTGLFSVAILYDLIPLVDHRYSDLKSSFDAYATSLAFYDLIIPISKFSSDVFQRYISTLFSQGDSIPASLVPCQLPSEPSHLFFSDPQDPVSPDIQKLLTLDYILSVGTIDERKNQLSLISAFIDGLNSCHLPQTLHLVLVGNVHPSVIDKLNLLILNHKENIHVLSYANDPDLAALYSSCLFTSFPSLYEGYGLPIAEASWHNKLAICHNDGSTLEVSTLFGQIAVDCNCISTLLSTLVQTYSLVSDPTLDPTSRILPQITWSDYCDSLLAIISSYQYAPIRHVAIYVEKTVNATSYNSGIQRVTRTIASSIQQLAPSLRISFVTWSHECHCLRPVTEEEYRALSLYNGPSLSYSYVSESNSSDYSWLFLPEPVLPNPNICNLVEYARANRYLIAALFHDTIVLESDIHSDEAKSGYAYYTKNLTACDVIFPTSQYETNRLKHWLCKLGVSIHSIPCKIIPISLPLPPLISESFAITASKPTSIRILQVGTLEPRKNLLVAISAVIESFELLRHQGIEIHYTIAGSTKLNPQYFSQVQAAIAGYPFISIVDAPSDHQLTELYQSCSFTIFSSLREGFGLPIIESLSFSKPVICAPTGFVHDNTDLTGIVLCDMLDSSALASSIVQLSSNPSFLSDLSKCINIRGIVEPPLAYAHRLLTHLSAYSRSTFFSSPSTLISLYQSRFSKHYSTSFCPPGSSNPILTIAVSTYNRASRLRSCLSRLKTATQGFERYINVIVVDNASSDESYDVASSFKTLMPSLTVHRNPSNVGILGNLLVCSKLATTPFVWHLGDDDLLNNSVLAPLLLVLQNRLHSVHLVNLSYITTTLPVETITQQHLDDYFSRSVDIPLLEGNTTSTAHYNDNMYSGIYSFISRRDHSIRAYQASFSHNKGFFSDVLSTIPFSFYAFNYMQNLDSLWFPFHSVLANMNVSWLQFALVWHLNITHQHYSLAARAGVSAEYLEHYHANHLSDATSWLHTVVFNPDASAALNLVDIPLFYELVHTHSFFQAHFDDFLEIHTKIFLFRPDLVDYITPLVFNDRYRHECPS